MSIPDPEPSPLNVSYICELFPVTDNALGQHYDDLMEMVDDPAALVNIVKAIGVSAEVIFDSFVLPADEIVTLSIFNDEEMIGIKVEESLIEIQSMGSGISAALEECLELTPVSCEKRTLRDVRKMLMLMLALLVRCYLMVGTQRNLKEVYEEAGEVHQHYMMAMISCVDERFQESLERDASENILEDASELCRTIAGLMYLVDKQRQRA